MNLSRIQAVARRAQHHHLQVLPKFALGDRSMMHSVVLVQLFDDTVPFFQGF